MNCHGGNEGKQGTHNHSPLKHMFHMIICCGLPVIIIVLLPTIARFSPGASRVLGLITPFLCPLMMIGMIPMMMKSMKGDKKKDCCDDKNNEIENGKVPKLNKTIK